MIALTAGMFSLATASPLSAQARGMAPHMMLNGSVANDGSDYTQVGTPAFHPRTPTRCLPAPTQVGSRTKPWFERIADDAEAPGAATGYWLDTALKGPDNAACIDGTAPLY